MFIPSFFENDGYIQLIKGDSKHNINFAKYLYFKKMQFILKINNSKSIFKK